ncbi:MAG: DUF11 domain-containing protein [Nitrospirae bacterium]|nr:DUF11 domain-containing protein [Nitrospirota bacterium]
MQIRLKCYFSSFSFFFFSFSAFLLFAPGRIEAAVTPAGTVISNTASVDYDIAGEPKPPISTPPTNFKVDRKLDVLVDEASSGRTAVLPGDTASGCNALGFNITNEGNSAQDFPLTLNQTGVTDPFGGADNFNIAALGNCNMRLDDGDGVCEASASDPVITKITSLAPGATVRVWVSCDIPSGRVDGDIAAVTLIASFAEGGGGADITTDDNGSPNNPNVVEDVFSDGNCPSTATSPGGCQAGNDINFDGRHSDTDSFRVVSAAVSTVKSVTVTDPLGGSEPVPGAVLTYILVVTAAGSATAENVVITDSIPANTTYKPGSLTLDTVVLTDASDADEGDAGASTPGAVTVRLGDLTSSSPERTVTFKVTIN